MVATESKHGDTLDFPTFLSIYEAKDAEPKDSSEQLKASFEVFDKDKVKEASKSEKLCTSGPGLLAAMRFIMSVVKLISHSFLFFFFFSVQTGKVGVTEFRHIVLNLGEKMTEEEANVLVKEADPSSSGCTLYICTLVLCVCPLVFVAHNFTINNVDLYT